MRKIFVALFALLAGSFVLWGFSFAYDKEVAKEKFTVSTVTTDISPVFGGIVFDVVNDIPPVSISDWRTDLVLRLQASCSAEDRQEIMRTIGKPLSDTLVVFMKNNPLYDEMTVDYISYEFGSGLAEKVESGIPISYSGIFHDQLIANVHFTGGITKRVLIKCLNGLFSIEDPEKLEVIASVAIPREAGG